MLWLRGCREVRNALRRHHPGSLVGDAWAVSCPAGSVYGSIKARSVVAAQFRRIEPRGCAPIENKRIVAAQAIAKQAGKLVEVHPPLVMTKCTSVGSTRRHHSEACDRLNQR
jgi:hypothetical protein